MMEFDLVEFFNGLIFLGLAIFIFFYGSSLISRVLYTRKTARLKVRCRICRYRFYKDAENTEDICPQCGANNSPRSS